MSFLKIIGVGLVTGAIFLTGFLFERQSNPVPQLSFGSSFTPAQIPQTTLSGAGVTSSQNTIPLTSFTTADGRAVTMAMLGSIGYGTLEPNTTSKEEIVSFTGVTQNANGTASLTGVTRGLDFVSPYASTASLMKSHAGGAYFIISNTAPFYGQQFLFANNVSTSSAGIVFSSTTPPHYDFNPTFVNFSTTTLASKGYVDNATAAGGSPLSSTVAGLGMLATALQAASSTATGVYNTVTYNRVLGASYATDTPQSCTGNGVTTGGCVVMALLNGKLHQSWLDLTQAFTFTGAVTHSATTTLACSSLLSNACVFRSLAYAWPSLRGASSTVMTEDGSGNLRFITPQTTVLNATSTVTTVSGTTASTTMVTVVIPAATLSNATMLNIDALASQTVNAAFFEIDIGNGSATTSLSNGSATSIEMNCHLYVPSATSEQAYCVQTSTGSTALTATSTIAGYNTASQLYIAFIARPSSSGSGTASYNGTSVILNRQ